MTPRYARLNEESRHTPLTRSVIAYRDSREHDQTCTASVSGMSLSRSVASWTCGQGPKHEYAKTTDDPLIGLPESLLTVMASFLPVKDVLCCRLVGKRHYRAFPKTLRRLQLPFPRSDMVDWSAFACLECLHLGPGGKSFSVHNASTHPLTRLFPPRSVRESYFPAVENLPWPFDVGRPLLPRLRELHMVGLGLDDDHLALLWHGIGRLTELECLNLDGNNLSDASLEAMAREVTAFLPPSVSSSSSSPSSSSFATTSSGSFSRLRVLKLSQNQFTAQGVARLLTALTGAGIYLRVLDLADNDLGSMGESRREGEAARGSRGLLCETLATMEAGARMEELWLSYTGMTDESLEAFASLVIGPGKLPRLARLELESNKIGNAGVEALAAALSAGAPVASPASCLTSLNLSKNYVGNRGVQALGRALEEGRCSRLRRLDVSGNWVAAPGAMALARVMTAQTTSLQCLNLAWNDLGDTGMVAFAEHVCKGGGGEREEEPMATLERLELSNNSIGDAGMHALAAALRRAPALARLHAIDLTGNDFHALGLMALEKVMKGGRAGEEGCGGQENEEVREGGVEGGFLPEVKVYDGLLLEELVDSPLAGPGGKGGRREGRVRGGRGARRRRKDKGGGDARQLLLRRQEWLRGEEGGLEARALERWMGRKLSQGVIGIAWTLVWGVMAHVLRSRTYV